MFKKIFRASFLLTSLVLFFAVLLSAIVLSIDFDHTEMSALASQADLAASGVNTSGKKYLKNLKGENYRITWIDSKGQVLYDNEENPQKMGNHARREEVAEAMKKGTGTSERYSTTLSTVTMYYAERLNDGGVIRIAITRNSFWRMLLRLLSPLLLIMLLAVLVSWFLAKTISQCL